MVTYLRHQRRLPICSSKRKLEINNMLTSAIANQGKADLTAQQVLSAIVKGLTRVKLSTKADIPTERVTYFRRRQRHQGRQGRQRRNDEVGPSTSTQAGSSTSTQAGPSTSAHNEPTTFNEYNLINVNEYCMSLYQHIELSTSIGQGLEGLFSYDHYPQSSLNYHSSPPSFYSGQYNYGQDSQFSYEQPSQPFSHVGNFCTPLNT